MDGQSANVAETSLLDLDALIAELDAAIDHLPEEALRTCQKHPELVIPRLIEVLEEAVRLGREGTTREGNAPFFALFLLTEFQEKRALPVLLDAFALRDPVLDDLFGAAITETFPRTLAVLAGDQPDLLERMIGNRELDDYVRWEAAAALCRLVAAGQMTRDDALSRLMNQMRAAAAAEDWWGVTITVSEVGDLNPLEAQDEIKAAFDSNLVDESIIDWSCFEEFLLKPDQPGQVPELAKRGPVEISDTVQELRRWYSFKADARLPVPDWEAGRELLDDENFGHSRAYESSPYEPATIRHEAPKVGRNDPCPCGSGKKFKKCCLRAGNFD